jgi:hypothetical protein
MKSAPTPDFNKMFWRSPLWFDAEAAAQLVDEISASDSKKAKAVVSSILSQARDIPVENKWR